MWEKFRRILKIKDELYNKSKSIFSFFGDSNLETCDEEEVLPDSEPILCYDANLNLQIHR